MVEVGNHCSHGLRGSCQYRCDQNSGKHKQAKETVGLDNVDLEELQDSRKRAKALVLWLSCEGQIDGWEMFSDNSFLSAILDRQELQVAAPIDLRTKKAESFSPQPIQGFWQKLKEKNPKIVVRFATFEMKNFKKGRSGMTTVPFVY